MITLDGIGWGNDNTAVFTQELVEERHGTESSSIENYDISGGWIKSETPTKEQEIKYDLKEFGFLLHERVDLTTGFIGITPGSVGDLFDTIKAKQHASKIVQRKVSNRISHLRNEATEENEVVKNESANDLSRFLKAYAFHKLPRIFLLETGNFRAVWKNEAGEQIGIQFLGDGQIQFVIFAKREDSDHLSRSAGRDSFIGIHEQIQSFNLKKLICS